MPSATYHETGKFEYVNTGGYYHSLPGDPLRTFIDTTAEVQRAMGFENEKDHPEVAPSQFEINYGYGEVVAAADQIQLYKLICRQVATKMGMTASLPAQAGGGRQRQRHAHQRFRSARTARTCSGIRRAREKLSKFGWDFVDRILTHGNDICLLLNSSVNAYRRLDPHFEAPNQIKASAVDRGSMVRIPIGNEKQHARRGALRGPGRQSLPGDVLHLQDGSRRRDRQDQEPAPGRALPAGQHLHGDRGLPQSRLDDEAAGEDVKGRYADLKQASADRCPRLLGTFVKPPEVQFHHEVYNQFLWNLFLRRVCCVGTDDSPVAEHGSAQKASPPIVLLGTTAIADHLR